MDGARRTLLIVTGALLSIGMVMVYSSSFVMAEKSKGTPTYYLEHHAIYLILGCIALAVSSIYDYHRLARHWKWFILTALVLLAAVFIPGVGACINGSRRWIKLGASLTFQPSEAAKPLMIAGLAGWIVQTRDGIGTFTRGFLPAVVIAGSAVVLTAIEPDMGSAGLMASVFCAMLFVGGIRLTYAIPAFLIALPLTALLAYTKLGYIRSRIEDFMSGSMDERGAAYQIVQALIALGSGGATGAGLGQGHCKLLFLPEAHNDFIFASIGEELGLVGTLTVVALFMLFVIQGWRVARRAPDMLGTLIALGVTLCTGLQAAINIAVVTRSMPTKGIALPFISYGGSSLIFLLASVGLLLNVAAHPPSDAVQRDAGATPRKKGTTRLIPNPVS
ncbi:MAG: putative lipid II flippase FtsW [Planctomycetota bacterium]